MRAINYYYLEDEQHWLGYLQDYPDYWEEAETFDGVQANLSSELCPQPAEHSEG